MLCHPGSTNLTKHKLTLGADIIAVKHARLRIFPSTIENLAQPRVGGFKRQLQFVPKGSQFRLKAGCRSERKKHNIALCFRVSKFCRRRNKCVESNVRSPPLTRHGSFEHLLCGSELQNQTELDRTRGSRAPRMLQRGSISRVVFRLEKSGIFRILKNSTDNFRFLYLRQEICGILPVEFSGVHESHSFNNFMQSA